MTTPVRWTEAEILGDDPALAPYVVAGRRCHGGVDADGRYHSPRTRFRNAAIAAWQEQHRADFGTELFDAGLDSMSIMQLLLLIEEEFWNREPDYACAYAAQCPEFGSKRCSGLSGTYVRQFGWESALLTPLRRS